MTERDGDAHVAVRLQPRAAGDAIVGRRGDARSGRQVLAVRVTAPPVGGAANAALCKLLAKALGVPKGRVSVIRGQTGRNKLVRVEGIGADEVERKLG